MQELATGYGLIEGPVWDAGKGLYFSDVTNGGVFLLDAEDKVTQVVPKRRGIGGMALHEDGGIVVGGRDITWVAFGGERSKTLLTNEVTPEAVGFNDLTTDTAGRIYVGSLAFKVFAGDAPRPGHLHLIDLDGSVRTISDGIMLTNGLGVSPDGKRLYHSDARGGLVRVYDVNGDGGVGPWRKFCSLGADGVADGLKVASDGSVWIADAHGSRVAVFAADGSHRQDLKVPLPMVTSVCFGGEDLKDLYVVTGSRGGPRENCGTVFRTRVDVAGLPLAPARVALS